MNAKEKKVTFDVKSFCRDLGQIGLLKKKKKIGFLMRNSLQSKKHELLFMDILPAGALAFTKAIGAAKNHETPKMTEFV